MKPASFPTLQEVLIVQQRKSAQRSRERPNCSSSQLTQKLAEQPWESHFPSLGLNFIVYKMSEAVIRNKSGFSSYVLSNQKVLSAMKFWGEILFKFHF